MRIRNVDKNNDWTFGQSQLNYVQNEYAIVLDIKLKLQEWLEDCFFSLQNGIAWSVRLGSKNQKELLDDDIYNTALEVEGVLNIQNFTSIVDGRRYRAQFSVYTQYTLEPIPITFDSLQGVLNG